MSKIQVFVDTQLNPRIFSEILTPSGVVIRRREKLAVMTGLLFTNGLLELTGSIDSLTGPAPRTGGVVLTTAGQLYTEHEQRFMLHCVLPASTDYQDYLNCFRQIFELASASQIAHILLPLCDLGNDTYVLRVLHEVMTNIVITGIKSLHLLVSNRNLIHPAKSIMSSLPMVEVVN